MQAEPLVSVVVPVYNAEPYISRCLDSVFGQTYGNIEVVCIDDGSTDGSPALLDAYEKRYPDSIKVVHQKNAGVAAARNLGIQIATGEYLAFVDNDDWLDSDFIEVLLYVAVANESEVVCSGYRRPDEMGRVVLEAVPSPSDEWSPFLSEAAWAKLYRMDFVRSHGLRFLDTNILEDLYFSLPAVELSTRPQIVEYCGYNWFYNCGSVSNTRQKSSAGLRFEKTLDDLLDLMGQKRIDVSPILIHFFVRLVVWFLLYTRRGDGAMLSRQNLSRYTDWLDSNISRWREDPYALPARPTGDAIPNRLAVWLFVRHPRTFSLALRLYGGLG